MKVEHTSIPVSIMQQYKSTTLSVDIMKMSGISFLVTIFRHITFEVAGKLDNMKSGHIFKHFKALIGAYAIRGFKVTTMFADNQFGPMSGNLVNLHAWFHITSQDKHVPKL